MVQTSKSNFTREFFSRDLSLSLSLCYSYNIVANFGKFWGAHLVIGKIRNPMWPTCCYWVNFHFCKWTNTVTIKQPNWPRCSWTFLAWILDIKSFQSKVTALLFTIKRRTRVKASFQSNHKKLEFLWQPLDSTSLELLLQVGHGICKTESLFHWPH